MAQHLTKEEIELLSSRRLRGKGLLPALEHIESCKECRSQIKLPTTEEILKRFKPNPKQEIKSQSNK